MMGSWLSSSCPLKSGTRNIVLRRWRRKETSAYLEGGWSLTFAIVLPFFERKKKTLDSYPGNCSFWRDCPSNTSLAFIKQEFSALKCFQSWTSRKSSNSRTLNCLQVSAVFSWLKWESTEWSPYSKLWNCSNPYVNQRREKFEEFFRLKLTSGPIVHPRDCPSWWIKLSVSS